MDEDPARRFRLAQLVVDRYQRLHCRAGAGRKLQFLVVQRLGKRVTLLRQRPQRPALPPLSLASLLLGPAPSRKAPMHLEEHIPRDIT